MFRYLLLQKMWTIIRLMMRVIAIDLKRKGFLSVKITLAIDLFLAILITTIKRLKCKSERAELASKRVIIVVKK